MYEVREGYGGFSKLENGALSYSIAIMFTPNTNVRTRFYVVLEPSDTYSVYLVSRGKNALTLIDSASDVYCDMLQSCVESMYDKYILQFQEGFISI